MSYYIRVLISAQRVCRTDKFIAQQIKKILEFHHLADIVSLIATVDETEVASTIDFSFSVRVHTWPEANQQEKVKRSAL